MVALKSNLVVPGMGLEPIRTCVRRFLRPLRLPLRHPGGELLSGQGSGSRARRRCPGSRLPDSATLTGVAGESATHRRLVLVLGSGPDSTSADLVSGLAHAAVAAGHETKVFLMGDGVLAAGRVVGSGASLAHCDADWRWRRGGEEPDQRVLRGSLRDLAIWCREADRVLQCP
jgi:hypothetical protein